MNLWTTEGEVADAGVAACDRWRHLLVAGRVDSFTL